MKILMEQDFHAERFKEFLREVTLISLSPQLLISKLDKREKMRMGECQFYCLFSLDQLH